MRASFLALLLFGCAATAPHGVSREQSDLSSDLAGRSAGQPQICVSTVRSQNLRIVDPQTLVYGHGRTIWVNRLRDPCPGLRPFDTLIVEVRGAQYCRGDLVRGLTPGTTIPGPMCPLGDFIPYRLPR
jgi:hypothetical protein